MSRRRSTFGCLGCSWVVLMLVGTVSLVGVLWFMEPVWLVRLQWWKPPPQPPEVALLPLSMLPPQGEPTEVPPTAEESAERWIEMTTRADYRDAQGVTIETIEGSLFELPPGSVGSDQPIEVVPVLRIPEEMREGGVLPIGVVHDLRIGGQGHWYFQGPIRISMPFDPERLPEGATTADLSIVTWVEDSWRVLPSTFDAASSMLTGDTDHASMFGVGIFGGLAAWVRFSQPVEAVRIWFGNKTDAVYSTKNFTIHYFSQGANRPLDDPDYLSRTSFRGNKVEPHPRYITDIGSILEQERKWLPAAQLKVDEPWFDPWVVFVVPMSNFGASGLGGPLLIDNDMTIGEDRSAHLEWDMRRTVVHELIHVAQDEFFIVYGSEKHRWWLESSAEFLSVWLMQRNGFADPNPYYYIEDLPTLPKTALDRAEQMLPYAYARFFWWLQDRSIDVPSFIRMVNASGPSLSVIDEALRIAGSGGLANDFAAFAYDFYHPNLWRANITPEGTLSAILKDARSDLTKLNVLQVRGQRENPVAIRTYAQAVIEVPPMSSPFLPFHAKALPAGRQARLVLDMSTGASNISALTSEYRGQPLYSGDVSPFATHGLAPRVSVISTHRVANPGEAGQQDIDRVSAILLNRNLSGEPAQVLVQRWLLMAPAWVKAAALEGGRTRVWWHPAELKEEGGGVAFKGYRLYRGLLGTDPEDMQPLPMGLLQDETFVDDPPSGERWAYSVTVTDLLDNEGEPAPSSETADPFVGTWAGTFRVVRPKLAPIVIRYIKAEIAKSPPADGAPGGLSQVLTAIEGMVGAIDFILKIGVPWTWTIEFDNGVYIARPVTVFGKAVEDDGQPLRLRRVDQIGLAPIIPEGREHTPVVLRFNRNGTMKQDFKGMTIDPDLGRINYSFKLKMKRQEDEGG